MDPPFVNQDIPTLQEAERIAQETRAFSVRRKGNLVLFNYLYSDPEVWSAYPTSRNLRGTVYEEPTGKVVSLPFHKFFNLGEPLAPKLSGPIPDNVLVARKFDGYLIQSFVYEGKVHLASRHSFDYPLIRRALESVWEKRHEEFALAIEEEIGGLTLLWEVIHPDFPVLELPEEPKLVLLAARSIHSGEYFFPNLWDKDLDRIGVYDLPTSERFLRPGEVADWLKAKTAFPGVTTWEELHEMVRSLEGVEGFVAAFYSVAEEPQEGFTLFRQNLEFVKLKTRWAFVVSSVLSRPGRSIVQAVAEDKLDDLLAAFHGQEDRVRKISEAGSHLVSLYRKALSLGRDMAHGGISPGEAYRRLVNEFSPLGGLAEFFASFGSMAFRGQSDEVIWNKFRSSLLRKSAPIGKWLEELFNLDAMAPGDLGDR